MTNVVISPGHYESYRGVSKNGSCEYDEAKKIVDIILDKIQRQGTLKAFLVEGKLIDKVNQINQIKPDFAVEVHLGNANVSTNRGSRAFYMLKNKESKQLSTALLEACCDSLESENKGSWVGWYKKISPEAVESGRAPEGWVAKIDLFLSKTVCPSAQIEPYFISSPEDVEKFTTDDTRGQVADAIIEGLHRYAKSLNKNSGL